MAKIHGGFSLSLSLMCVHALNIVSYLSFNILQDQFIKLKAFSWLYLKLKFQSGSRIRSAGHLCESHYLLICSIIEVGKGSLSVIFVVPPNSKNVSPRQDSNYFHEFICQLDMDGSFLNCPLVLKVPKETFVGSFGLWLYISHARLTEHFNEGSCISSLIRPKMLDIQVKMCGARVLYEQDMVEFVQNSRQENFRSCNDLSRGQEKLIEDHMSNSQGPDPSLKRNLKSLLSRLYQVSSYISGNSILAKNLWV